MNAPINQQPAKLDREEIFHYKFNGKQILLFVVNDPKFFLSHRLNIAKAAKDAGLSVHVATPTEGVGNQIEAEGFTFHPIGLKRSSFNPFSDIITIVELFLLYRKIRPSIVHHVTIKPVIYGSIAARLAQVPRRINAVSGFGYVLCSTGAIATIRRWIVSGLYRIALGGSGQKTIFQNPDDRDTFVNQKFISLDNCVIIRGSGVDTDYFYPTDKTATVPTVLLAARLLWAKGIREFVEAATLLHSQGVSARFVIAGSLDEKNPDGIQQQQIEQWKLSSPVEFLGFQADMRQLLQSAHIACLPSYREGLPKALIEAAAAGKPIVTCDVPGCREIVEHNKNGFLVPVKNSTALAAALKQLIEDQSLRKSFGNAGRELVLEYGFSDKAVIMKTLELYAEDLN